MTDEINLYSAMSADEKAEQQWQRAERLEQKLFDECAARDVEIERLIKRCAHLLSERDKAVECSRFWREKYDAAHPRQAPDQRPAPSTPKGATDDASS